MRRFFLFVALIDSEVSHTGCAVGKTAFFLSFPYVCPEPVLAK
jgi:hypothetical protein